VENLVIHEEQTHVNEATVKVLTGEKLTLHRSKGYFRCQWCCHGTTTLASSHEMEVRNHHRFPPAGI
jgi:hypothetical protein